MKLTPEQKQAVRDAALEELISRGIDDFSMPGVASRVDIDESVLIQEWPDRRVLLMDAQLRLARRNIPTPNTGTLRGDLQAVAESLNQIASTRNGRRWFHRLLPADESADLSEVRADFWSLQDNGGAEVFQRAIERGEIREDIDPVHAIQQFKAAIYHDVIFGDNPPRPDYVSQVIEIMVRGVTR